MLQPLINTLHTAANNKISMQRPNQRWDIFCTVVDNFGDIGVCWRLARQLATEHDLSVRLWVDDLLSFQHICPEINPALTIQIHQKVEVVLWTKASTSVLPTEVADVVIEAFACDLPTTYIEAMAQRPVKPVWLNLEYLSAEPWVTGCHAMASPHPQLPLNKYFFFPGFVSGTGGLFRERDLLARREAFQNNKQAQNEFWSSLNLPPVQDSEIRVSLFSYENSELGNLLNTWANSAQPISCLIPVGRTSAQFAQHIGRDEMLAGDYFKSGNLSVYILPFVKQENYDYLLWACDVNFVRGEDSFVRSQWAARPFVWHIYPQDEATHLIKLNAFLDLYTQGLSNDSALAVKNFWQAWNSSENIAETWPVFLEHLEQLSDHMNSWIERIVQHGDISTNLVHFCKKCA